MRAVSKRRDGVQPAPDELVVDVDRTTPLGNPFVMHSESERDKVCDQYATYLPRLYAQNGAATRWLDRLALRQREGHKIALRCWCAPKRCHADEIVKFVNALNAGG